MKISSLLKLLLTYISLFIIDTIEKLPDGTYRITSKGKSLIGIYDTISTWYKIDKKLIHPSIESTK